MNGSAQAGPLSERRSSMHSRSRLAHIGVVIVVVVAALAAGGCVPSVGEPGAGERLATADALEASAYAELQTMHRAEPRAARAARDRLEAMERDPNAVDAVDRAAVRFLSPFSSSLEANPTSEAVWFLGDRGFEPEDQAVPRQPAAVADVEVAALARLADPASGWNRGPAGSCRRRFDGPLDDTVIERAAARVPVARGSSAAEASPRGPDGEWPRGPMRHAIGRVRWVAVDTAKVETRSGRAGSSCKYGGVIVLRKEDGRWSAVRTIRTWVT